MLSRVIDLMRLIRVNDLILIRCSVVRVRWSVLDSLRTPCNIAQKRKHRAKEKTLVDVAFLLKLSVLRSVSRVLKTNKRYQWIGIRYILSIHVSLFAKKLDAFRRRLLRVHVLYTSRLTTTAIAALNIKGT